MARKAICLGYAGPKLLPHPQVEYDSLIPAISTLLGSGISREELRESDLIRVFPGIARQLLERNLNDCSFNLSSDFYEDDEEQAAESETELRPVVFHAELTDCGLPCYYYFQEFTKEYPGKELENVSINGILEAVHEFPESDFTVDPHDFLSPYPLIIYDRFYLARRLLELVDSHPLVTGSKADPELRGDYLTALALYHFPTRPTLTYQLLRAAGPSCAPSPKLTRMVETYLNTAPQSFYIPEAYADEVCFSLESELNQAAPEPPDDPFNWGSPINDKLAYRYVRTRPNRYRIEVQSKGYDSTLLDLLSVSSARFEESEEPEYSLTVRYGAVPAGTALWDTPNPFPEASARLVPEAPQVRPWTLCTHPAGPLDPAYSPRLQNPPTTFFPPARNQELLHAMGLPERALQLLAAPPKSLQPPAYPQARLEVYIPAPETRDAITTDRELSAYIHSLIGSIAAELSLADVVVVDAKPEPAFPLANLRQQMREARLLPKATLPQAAASSLRFFSTSGFFPAPAQAALPGFPPGTSVGFALEPYFWEDAFAGGILTDRFVNADQPYLGLWWPREGTNRMRTFANAAHILQLNNCLVVGVATNPAYDILLARGRSLDAIMGYLQTGTHSQARFSLVGINELSLPSRFTEGGD